jgi:nickel-dependent lactate racemase
MGKSQRTKGAGYEREIVRDLHEVLGVASKRNLEQTRSGGGDIILDNFVIECKRRAGIAVYEWMRQCEASCNETQKPIVVCRADGEKSLAIMRWSDFMTLLGNELPESKQNSATNQAE